MIETAPGISESKWQQKPIQKFLLAQDNKLAQDIDV